MNNWLYLILAIILETFGTTCLKLSNGFSVVIFYAFYFYRIH